MLLVFLIAVIAFCAVMIVFTVVDDAKRKKLMRERLGTASISPTGEEELQTEVMSGEMSSGAAALKKLMGLGMNVDESIRKLELKFAHAGMDSKDGPVFYLFFQRIASFVFAALGLLIILKAEGDDALLMQCIGFFIIILGVFGPNLYLSNKTQHRMKTLQRAFPDTLDLLLICVESGLALDAALSRVCNELALAYPEMTKELNRTRLELALLNDRVKALMNLGERTNMVAFRSLVVALVQSERFGTSLTDTLRVLSEDFRLQRLAAAEAKAARLPVLLTIPLIFLLMPAFMMIVLGPAIVSMMHNGSEVTGK